MCFQHESTPHQSVPVILTSDFRQWFHADSYIGEELQLGISKTNQYHYRNTITNSG